MTINVQVILHCSKVCNFSFLYTNLLCWDNPTGLLNYFSHWMKSQNLQQIFGHETLSTFGTSLVLCNRKILIGSDQTCEPDAPIHTQQFLSRMVYWKNLITEDLILVPIYYKSLMVILFYEHYSITKIVTILSFKFLLYSLKVTTIIRGVQKITCYHRGSFYCMISNIAQCLHKEFITFVWHSFQIMNHFKLLHIVYWSKVLSIWKKYFTLYSTE